MLVSFLNLGLFGPLDIPWVILFWSISHYCRNTAASVSGWRSSGGFSFCVPFFNPPPPKPLSFFTLLLFLILAISYMTHKGGLFVLSGERREVEETWLGGGTDTILALGEFVCHDACC